ncbi:MAG: Z1 domain-containing protein, partial [Alphaproteobacteria bacterium]
HDTVAALISQPTDARKPGMLLGKIQSGKTRAFLGIIAESFDNGFDVAVVLTKGTKTLAKQTVNRISKEFAIFRDAEQLAVYDIMTVPDLADWEIDEQKLVFVSKKETNNLRRLVKLFADTHPALSQKRVLIIDDEADFASIRFTKKKGSEEIEQGRIADRIDELRRELTNPAVLQVTATPYSLYLQPDEYDAQPGANFTFEDKRPAFTKLVPIHSGYVGGDHYFGEHDETKPEYYLWHEVQPDELVALKKEDRRRIKKDQVLITDKAEALRHALVTFVVAAAVRRLQQKQAGEALKRYAMIVHVETSRNSHTWQHTVAGDIIEGLRSAIKFGDKIFSTLVDKAIKDVRRSVEAEGLVMPDSATVLNETKAAFQKGAVVIEKVNSDNDVEALLDENAELRLRTPYNVFIGGQILDRGITVPNLIGFYYGRSPRRMQQDTVLQHARMYGSRPRSDLAVTRFYTTAHNYMALRSIHEFDSALRHAFETHAHDRGVAFVIRDQANHVIPCSPNKILASDIVSLRPGQAYVPFGFQTKAKTTLAAITQAIDALIPKAALDTDQLIKVPTDLAIQIICLTESCLDFEQGYEFGWESFRAAVEYFSRIASPPTERNQSWLYAKTGRTIGRMRSGGRFSNEPHSYQDRAIIRQTSESLPTLAIFRQEGAETNGWRGSPFWWPILFAPTRAMPSIFASTINGIDNETTEDAPQDTNGAHSSEEAA